MRTGWSFPALASLQRVVLLVASIWTTCEARSRRSSGSLTLSLNLAGDRQQAKMVSLSFKERVWSSSRADSMRRWMEASMGLLSLKSADPARPGKARTVKSKRPHQPCRGLCQCRLRDKKFGVRRSLSSRLVSFSCQFRATPAVLGLG